MNHFSIFRLRKTVPIFLPLLVLVMMRAKFRSHSGLVWYRITELSRNSHRFASLAQGHSPLSCCCPPLPLTPAFQLRTHTAPPVSFAHCQAAVSHLHHHLVCYISLLVWKSIRAVACPTTIVRKFLGWFPTAPPYTLSSPARECSSWCAPPGCWDTDSPVRLNEF
jgi:hypothetical protein